METSHTMDAKTPRRLSASYAATLTAVNVELSERAHRDEVWL
jgi:hypothetical protein